MIQLTNVCNHPEHSGMSIKVKILNSKLCPRPFWNRKSAIVLIQNCGRTVVDSVVDSTHGGIDDLGININ